MRLLIDEIRLKWAAPSKATHRGKPCPFLLRCQLGDAAPDSALREIQHSIPDALSDFWRAVGSGRLFEDVQYGQWGLEFLQPQEATTESARFHTERQKDARRGDLVVGRFLGDADLLFVRCDPEESDFGKVLVALPIDRRDDWYEVADGFDSFLERYVHAEGDKYWEVEGLTVT